MSKTEDFTRRLPVLRPKHQIEPTPTAQVFQRHTYLPHPAPASKGLSSQQPPTVTKTLIHRKPASTARKCLACGNSLCRLSTHKAYTERVLVSRKRAQENRIVLPKSELTNPRIDPFARYPIDMTAEDHYFLDLWVRPWGEDPTKGPERHLFPKPNLELFLQDAMISPLVLRASLALTSTQRSFATGKISASAYDQQQKAYKLHREATRDLAHASKDENILAALAIASNHMAQGSIGEADLLLEGVNRLVKARGGPHYLGFRGVLAGYLLYADHVRSVCQCRRPEWPIPLPSLQFPQKPLPGLGRGFRDLHRRKMLDSAMCEGAVDLCRATEIFALGARGKAEKHQLESFAYISAAAEYQLAYLHAENYSLEPRHRCICLALLIFDHTVLRNSGVIPPPLRLLEARFWKSFNEADAEGHWEAEDTYLLIWLTLTPLVIAGRATCDYVDYAVQRLRPVQQKAKIGGWEDLKGKVLEPFVWFDMAQEKLLMRIWKDIQRPPITEVKQ